MSAGEMAASMAVFEFPPRFSLSSQVRTESLNGMWSPFFFFPFAFPPANSAKAEMTCENVSSKAVNVVYMGLTLPRVVRDLLMLAPSLRRVPFAPVDSALSDPARSTRETLLT